MLAWVELSSGDPAGPASSIRVMLASAGSEADVANASPQSWHPASATRNRDLFTRPTAAPPDRSTAPARKRVAAPPMTAPVTNVASASAETAAETPLSPRPAATTRPAVPRPSSQGKLEDDAATGSGESAPDPDEIAATEPAGHGMRSENPGADAAANTTPASAASGAPSAAPADAAADNNGRLLALLHQAIDRSKHYPSLAKRQRREGTATVRFRLSPNGDMDAIDIDRSSGFRVLDTAAISAVSSVAPFAPAQALLTEASRFTIDVTFRLN